MQSAGARGNRPHRAQAVRVARHAPRAIAIAALACAALGCASCARGARGAAGVPVTHGSTHPATGSARSAPPPTTTPTQAVPTTTPVAPGSGPGVLLDFSGSANAYPPAFDAPGHWTLEWAFSCPSNADPGDDHFLVRLADGTTQTQNMGLLAESVSKPSATGWFPSTVSGTIQLFVTANCPWNIKAVPASVSGP